MNSKTYILTYAGHPISDRFETFEEAFEAIQNDACGGTIKVQTSEGRVSELFIVGRTENGETVITMKRA